MSKKLQVTVEYEVFIVTDSRGKSCAAVVSDSSDYASIYGLVDKNGNTFFLDCEAYHLATECERRGCKLSHFKESKTYEVEK